MSELELPPSSDSVPRARAFVRGTLRGSRSDIDTVLLLVSELVTNAVLHARSVMRLVVRDRDGVVRVEVHDGSPVPPRMHHFRPSSGTGRGLRMVDRLSRAWGADPIGPGGKVVWFEVGTPGESSWEPFSEDVLEGVNGEQ